MFVSKTVVLFFFILCFVQLHYGAGTVQKHRGSQRFNEGRLFIGKKSFDKGNLIFAVCNRISSSTVECRITQRVYPKKGDVRTCNITLKGDQDESELHMGVEVTTLGKNKAILYWGEDCKGSMFVKIGTVNLETCKINVVKINDPKRDTLLELLATDKIVTHKDDSFDVFMYDIKQFGDKIVKIPVNADGTAKGEPVITKIKAGMITYLSPIATSSSSKGYAAIRGEGYSLMLIKPEGPEIQLEKYNKTSRPVYSAGENAVSSCVKTNADSDVTCKQFDENGNVKYTTTV